MRFTNAMSILGIGFISSADSFSLSNPYLRKMKPTTSNSQLHMVFDNLPFFAQQMPPPSKEGTASITTRLPVCNSSVFLPFSSYFIFLTSISC